MPLHYCENRKRQSSPQTQHARHCEESSRGRTTKQSKGRSMGETEKLLRCPFPLLVKGQGLGPQRDRDFVPDDTISGGAR